MMSSFLNFLHDLLVPPRHFSHPKVVPVSTSRDPKAPMSEKELDKTLQDSFPASDPPSH